MDSVAMSSDEKNRYPLIPVSCPSDCDFDANIVATFVIEVKLFTNASIRALNSMYYNAPRVKPGDEGDFAGYCLTSIAAIYDGHQEQALEKLVFPVLQEVNDMTPFVQRHASYRDRINMFNEYMKSVAEKGPYDGTKARELLESFGDDLVDTLRQEVDIFDPERLRACDEDKVKEMFKTHREMSQNLITKTPAIIFIIAHHDLKTAPTWPAQVKDIGPANQLTIYTETRGYWKFAPYSIEHTGKTQTYA